jgi:hypothetical protein
MAIINQGQILLEAEPLGAIESIQGKVWKKIVARDELADHEARYRVISTRLLAGRTVIHVFSPERPDPGFDPVEASLEDVYFTAMAGLHTGEASLAGAEAAS